MWPRIVECMLGCWMLMSPFIFDHDALQRGLWINDLSVGAGLTICALASYWRYTRWSHVLELGIGLWLIGFARLGQSPPLEPGQQNELIVGLLILLTAVVPNEASQPPLAWRQKCSEAEHPDKAGS